MNFNLKEIISSIFTENRTVSEDTDGSDYFTKRPPHPFESACYAPFKSMYFGHGGKVVACCQNRNHVLGTYPLQTVKEIWQSDKANELREALKNNHFNLGCEYCHNRILSKNYKGLIAAAYDHLPLSHEDYPTDLEFELNNTCNLECIMCNGEYSSLIRSKKEKRPPLAEVYDNAFIAQLTEFIPYLSKASFFGGEPFLIDIYYDIWEEIARLNPAVNIYVQTNGTVLNNRVKNLLERSKFHINISVDSVSTENYPRIRVNGDWNKTRQNIEWFAGYCNRKNIQLGISICPMQQNWHELVDIIKLANAWGATAFIHQLVSPLHTALRALPKRKLEIVYHTIKQQLEAYSADTEIARYNLQVVRDFLKEIQYKIDHNIPVILNQIDTIYDFYILLEKKLQKDALGYEPALLLSKLKEALSGLETNPEIVEKFRVLNINHESTWREIITGINKSDPERIRYEIITKM